MIVLEIVKKFLIENGYDGLALPGDECGCVLGDLAPCLNDISQCQPGYYVLDGDGEWSVDISPSTIDILPGIIENEKLNRRKKVIKNLTPHTLHLYDENGIEVVLSIPPSGMVAREGTKREYVGEIDGVPVFRTEYGSVVGLPAPCPGVVYVVSGKTRSHADVCNRSDVYQPGELLRDEAGRTIGAIGLSR